MAYLDDLKAARDNIAAKLATMELTENYSAEGRSLSPGTLHAQLVRSLARMNELIKTAENEAFNGISVTVAAKVYHVDGGIADGGFINRPR